MAWRFPACDSRPNSGADWVPPGFYGTYNSVVASATTTPRLRVGSAIGGGHHET